MRKEGWNGPVGKEEDKMIRGLDKELGQEKPKTKIEEEMEAEDKAAVEAARQQRKGE